MEPTDKNAEDNDLFSSMLGGILSNPEMMSAISSMADKLKNNPPAPPPRKVENDAPKEAEKVEIADAPAVPAVKELSGALGSLAPLLSGGGLKNFGADDDKACLLRALKPYLNKSRCDAIDQIITVSKLSHILKNNGR